MTGHLFTQFFLTDGIRHFPERWLSTDQPQALCVLVSAVAERLEVRVRFASNLRNLALASPRGNRHRKGGKDAAVWLQARNRCRFAARVVEIPRPYDPTMNCHPSAARRIARCRLNVK